MLPSPFDRADLYDALFDDLDFDVPYWLEFVREGRGPALEVACGSGRILVRLLDAGLEVDGLDDSEPMLRRAREKLARLGYHAQLARASMTSFALPKRYARILCAFNSFAHNTTLADQLATLERCREHLAPGGAFGLYLSFPRPELWTGPTERVLEREVPDPRGGGTLRIYDSRELDPVAQSQVSTMEIETVDPAGKVVGVERSRTNLRWVYKNELELLFARAGFRELVIHGAFDRSPLTAASEHLLAVARA